MFGSPAIDSYEYRSKITRGWLLFGFLYIALSLGTAVWVRYYWKDEQGECQGWMFTQAMVDGSFQFYRNNKVAEGDPKLVQAPFNRCLVTDLGMTNGQHMYSVTVPPKIHGWQILGWLGEMLVIFAAQMGYFFLVNRRYRRPHQGLR
jgi:hypothetical protein